MAVEFPRLTLHASRLTLHISRFTNRAPAITGVPVTAVQAGTPYVFVPGGTDPDGDPLTYSIHNQPSWAAFDPASGALAGTPAAPDAGVTSGIVIAVSDGNLTTSLPPFALTVTVPPPEDGNAAGGGGGGGGCFLSALR